MKREQVEESARKLIGARWHHQGRSLTAGIDCIGGVVFIAKDTGYLDDDALSKLDLVDYSRKPDAYQTMVSKIRECMDEIPLSELKHGDVVIIRMVGEKVPSHIGTVVRGRKGYNLIHSLESKTTQEESIQRWYKYITNVFRFRGIE